MIKAAIDFIHRKNVWGIFLALTLFQLVLFRLAEQHALVAAAAHPAGMAFGVHPAFLAMRQILSGWIIVFGLFSLCYFGAVLVGKLTDRSGVLSAGWKPCPRTVYTPPAPCEAVSARADGESRSAAE